MASSDAIAKMKGHMRGFQTPESRQNGINFKPEPSDVIITTSPKSGTTWLQHIVHGLRTAGQLEGYRDISAVVPWLELAQDLGQDLYSEQAARPRAFKSHLWEPACPKGCKKIVVFRDPHKVGPSFFHFFQGWFFEEGAVDIDTFIEEFWVRRGEPATVMDSPSCWHFMASWWARRSDPDVLLLFFEDLQLDLAGEVRRVADFIGVGEGDEALLEKVVRQSTLASMQEHGHLFNDALAREKRNPHCGLPPEAGAPSADNPGGSSKVRHPSEKRAAPSETTRAAIDARWDEVLAGGTGLGSYGEMRARWREESGRGPLPP